MKKSINKGNTQVTERTYTFLVLYALMLLLWLLGNIMGREVTIRKIESLNSFECPMSGEIRNEYDCTRFNLEKHPEYPFFFETEFPIFDLNISMRIFRQTGLYFNEDRKETIKATLYKLELDSDGKIVNKQVFNEYDLDFECKANEWICGPLIILQSEQYPSGKNHFLMEFKNPSVLFKTIRHIELIMETFDQGYQKYVVWFKLSMLILVGITSYIYYSRLKKYNVNSWSVEQIWVLFLSGAVIGLNDPFAILYYRFGVKFVMIFSEIVLVVSFSLILPFWIATLRTIREKQQTRFLTFPETIFAGANLLINLICTMLVANRPSFFFLLFRAINVFGAGWITIQFIRALADIRKLLWVDKMFMLTTAYFAFTYFGLIYQWATPIDVYSRNYAKVLALICLFTVYVLMCQYLYIMRKDPSYKPLNERESDKKPFEFDIERTDSHDDN